MHIDSLKTFIKENSARDIYYEYLLGQNVWYFQEKIRDEDPLIYYDKFKKFISLQLGVHFNNISIIGSAKTKFSFSPKKNFKEFDDENSDFDIVIVSNDLFMFFWKAFSEIATEQRVRNYTTIASGIFRRFISIKDDDENYNSEALRDWQRKLTNFKTQLQLEYKIYTDVNYRIYANWESVESYHIQGIKKLKDLLNETN